MSASAIQDGFITTLSSASVYGSGNVSKNFSVFETSSTCCCVIGLTGFTNQQMTFGRGSEDSTETVWTFNLKLGLKDTGSASALMDRIPEVADKLVVVMRDDNTIQGTCEEVVRVRGDRDPNSAFTVGGHAWLVWENYVEVREYT